MNTHQWYMMGLVSVQPPNTIIVGVSASIPNASSLATKLGISVGRIENFTIVGADIKCRITGGGYTIPWFVFVGDTSITYYTDSDNLVTDIGTEAFKDVTLLKELDFKGVVTLTGTAIARTSSVNKVSLENCISITGTAFSSSKNIKTIYIPRCSSLGATVLNNNVFDTTESNWTSTTLYVPISLQTVNAGAPDGDITFFVSKGGTVKYVSNFIAPSAPVIASATGYRTYVNLSVSTSSTNAVDYYELYNNGVFVKNIPTTGFIDDLAQLTSFNFSVIAVDVMYNKSPMSNVVATATTTTSLMPLTNLISYWKMNSDSNDSYGSNNGVSTYISYEDGKITNSATFNGTLSIININDNSNLSFNDASSDLPFSISYWVNTTDTQFSIINKSGATTREYECQYSGGQLTFRLISLGNISNRIDQTVTTSLNSGTWKHVVHTYNGGGSTGLKTYINGSLIASTAVVSGTYVKMSNTTDKLVFGGLNFSGAWFLNGKLDEISIFNAVLTAGEVTTIYNSGNGLTL